jgi:hypothetical protein
MLYQQLITFLEDFAEPVSLVRVEPSPHTRWIIPAAIEPTGQWLESAILLNPYLSDSEAVRGLVNAILDAVANGPRRDKRQEIVSSCSSR